MKPLRKCSDCKWGIQLNEQAWDDGGPLVCQRDNLILSKNIGWWCSEERRGGIISSFVNGTCGTSGKYWEANKLSINLNNVDYYVEYEGEE